MERKRSKWMHPLPISRGQLGRRQFLCSVAGLGLSAAGLALLNGCAGSPAAPGVVTETLETTTIRFTQNAVVSVCSAPIYMAEDFLKAEGFTDVQYIKTPGSLTVSSLVAGESDMTMQFSGPSNIFLDQGKPLTMLAGVHVGCFVLFGREHVNTIGELKGKTISITVLGGPEHVYLASMLAYVGLNPTTDVNWIVLPQPEGRQRFIDGTLDAVLAFPPFAQELQAKQIGHVIVSSMMDKPWSQYFCCMVVGRQAFVQQNPVATKRALRAILKATDVIAREPERGARFMVDRGFATDYEYALKALQDIPYNTWRDYDPTDTMRFFALRLRDAGMIKSTPDQIIAQGTDWRFLNELKKELPAYAPSAQSGGLLCQVGKPVSS